MPSKPFIEPPNTGLRQIRLGIFQSNPTVGAVQVQVDRLKQACRDAYCQKADVVVTSELYLTGYPPRDLLTRADFLCSIEQAVHSLQVFSCTVPDMGIVVGCPMPLARGKGLTNAALLICNGHLLFRYDKRLLPFYDVFDEPRYFEPGTTENMVEFKGIRLGFSICEDAWGGLGVYSSPDPMTCFQGIELLINLSASPYSVDKPELRTRVFQGLAKQLKVPVGMVNQVGGQDEVVFDGSSLVVNSEGKILKQGSFFEEFCEVVTVPIQLQSRVFLPSSIVSNVPKLTWSDNQCAQVAVALQTGLYDFVSKCGANQVVLGLSGGIDSAVVAVLAVKALGKSSVTGVLMPSMYSSEGSVVDALHLAQNLGIRTVEFPITSLWNTSITTLATAINQPSELMQENLQSRLRGVLVMAWANQTGAFALATGNKSELAMGYCTQYGDMNGALAPIGDLYKTQVYQLAKFFNMDEGVIPLNTLQKPPSAELRPGQVDQDSLPPYPVLDQILMRRIECGAGVAALIAEGFDPELVTWILKTLDEREFKRWQAPPILRVSSHAFGVGYRVPISKRLAL